MISSCCVLVFLSCFVQLLLLPDADAAPDWISPEILEMVKADKMRCMAEHGTTEDMIDELNLGKLKDDRTITCYVFCLFESFGLVDENANLEIEMFTGFLPKHLQSTIIEALTACANEQGSDVCNRMFNMGKCVYSKNPELWFVL